jgi:hypothetical protein
MPRKWRFIVLFPILWLLHCVLHFSLYSLSLGGDRSAPIKCCPYKRYLGHDVCSQQENPKRAALELGSYLPSMLLESIFLYYLLHSTATESSLLIQFWWAA